MNGFNVFLRRGTPALVLRNNTILSRACRVTERIVSIWVWVVTFCYLVYTDDEGARSLGLCIRSRIHMSVCLGIEACAALEPLASELKGKSSARFDA